MGHDVLWASESLAGEPDASLLEIALLQRRIIITQDKGFAAIASEQLNPPVAGLVFIRLDGLRRSELVQAALNVFGSRADWSGHFAIISRTATRVRKLPQ